MPSTMKHPKNVISMPTAANRAAKQIHRMVRTVAPDVQVHKLMEVPYVLNEFEKLSTLFYLTFFYLTLFHFILLHFTLFVRLSPSPQIFCMFYLVWYRYNSIMSMTSYDLKKNTCDNLRPS